MKKLITTLLVILGPNLMASTFVGNGGNAGDVELLVTINQIKDTFNGFSRDEEGNTNLCKCSPIFANNKICQYLNDLDKEQKLYCSKVLLEQADSLYHITSKKKNINFNWTHEEIEVFEHGEKIGADAVTNPKTREITINQKRFLNMKSYDRLFLVTHEVLHLLKHEGKRFDDEGSYGPFKGKNGGRLLLNSLAAATVVQAYEYQIIDKYQTSLKRSQSWKNNWIDSHFGSTNISNIENSNTFAQERYNSSLFRIRRYFGNFGLVAGYESSHGQLNFFTSTKATEKFETYSAGVTFKYHISDDVLSFAGQSHLVFNILGEYLKADFDISDNTINIQESSSSFGGAIECNYFMPFFAKGFWWHIGGRLAFHNYKYSNFTANYDKLRHAATLGVSYAF